jgi:hypothetical protein
MVVALVAIDKCLKTSLSLWLGAMELNCFRLGLKLQEVESEQSSYSKSVVWTVVARYVVLIQGAAGAICKGKLAG